MQRGDGRRAVEALGELRSGAVSELLVLALSDSDPEVRKSAAESLGEHE